MQNLHMQPAVISPVEAINRTIRTADVAVAVCQAQFPPLHLARTKMDEAIILLHDARRAAEG